MSEDSEINLRILLRHYREHTSLPLAFALLGESGETDESLADLLRGPVFEVKAEEAAGAVVHLLDFCSLLEVASIVQYVPADFPVKLHRTVLGAIERPPILDLYLRRSPRILVELLRRRLHSTISLLEADPSAIPIFLQFLDIAPMFDEDPKVRGFLRSSCSDDQWRMHKSLSDALERPETYLAGMASIDHDIQGFSAFLRFCRSFSGLLDACKLPLLQSVLWHHFGHWFATLRNAGLIKIDDLLDRFAGWEQYSEAEDAAFDETHESIESLREIIHELCGTRYQQALIIAVDQAAISEGSSVAVLADDEERVIPNAHQSEIKLKHARKRLFRVLNEICRLKATATAPPAPAVVENQQRFDLSL